MEKFPEKENLQPEEEVLKPEEEFSTIFSDPKEHKKVKSNVKLKKILTLSLCGVLVAAIIGSAFWIVKNIELKKTDEDKGAATEKIRLVDYGADYNSIDPKENITSVKLTNSNGSFHLYSKTVAYQDTYTGTDSYELNWFLEGYDSTLTDSDVIKEKVNKLLYINAIRKIDSKTEKECGLDKPVVEAEVAVANGTKFTVSVGGKSPDNAGIYVKVSSKEGIYLVNSDMDTELDFADVDLASLEQHPGVTLDEKYSDYFASDSIQNFDDLTISGKNFEQKLVFEINPDTELASYIPYVMVSPEKRGAENLDDIYTSFSQGFAVRGAYSYDAKDATLKKFGLDKPDFVMSMRFDDFVYTYKFALQSDGYYAVVGTDSKNVKKVSVEDLPYIEYGLSDFYSKVIYITPISLVSNVTLETPEKTYSFDISENPNGSEELNKYIVECDGKLYNSSYFQTYYRFLCELQCMDFEVEETTAKPVLTITYTYIDKNKKPTVIEFRESGSTKYQCSLNGVPLGSVGSTSYNKIFKNLERLLAGKQVLLN